jgi:hypothetical protein
MVKLCAFSKYVLNIKSLACQSSWKRQNLYCFCAISCSLVLLMVEAGRKSVIHVVRMLFLNSIGRLYKYVKYFWRQTYRGLRKFALFSPCSLLIYLGLSSSSCQSYGICTRFIDYQLTIVSSAVLGHPRVLKDFFASNTL